MKDNFLIKEIISLVKDGIGSMDLDGLDQVAVKQNYQPTTQGAESGPALYLYKIGDDRRYGATSRTERWDKDQNAMIHTETQLYESDFQISTLYRADPEDIEAYTASDLANFATAVLQSDKTISYLSGIEIGILRITEVRNPVFSNDKNQFEAAPSFDFTLRHQQVIISQSDVVETVKVNINRV